MQDQVFPFPRYWPERCLDLSSALLYDTPDRLLTLLQLSPQTMIQGYGKLLESSLSLCPFWRLQLEQPPEIEPLSGALINRIFEEFPHLLNAYQHRALSQLAAGLLPTITKYEACEDKVSHELRDFCEVSLQLAIQN